MIDLITLEARREARATALSFLGLGLLGFALTSALLYGLYRLVELVLLGTFR